MSEHTPDNIRQFEYFAGMIFGKLYDALPNPIALDYYEIALEKKFDEADWLADADHSKSVVARKNAIEKRVLQNVRVMTCLNTAQWLRQERFIHFHEPAVQFLPNFKLPDATLGEKGLVAMNRVPPELDGQFSGEEHFGNMLLRFVNRPALVAKDAAIAEVVRLIFSSITR